MPDQLRAVQTSNGHPDQLKPGQTSAEQFRQVTAAEEQTWPARARRNQRVRVKNIAERRSLGKAVKGQLRFSKISGDRLRPAKAIQNALKLSEGQLRRGRAS